MFFQKNRPGGKVKSGKSRPGTTTSMFPFGTNQNSKSYLKRAKRHPKHKRWARDKRTSTHRCTSPTVPPEARHSRLGATSPCERLRRRPRFAPLWLTRPASGQRARILTKAARRQRARILTSAAACAEKGSPQIRCTSPSSNEGSLFTRPISESSLWTPREN